MLPYPCLVLDHDDTVVKSTAQVHYPAYVAIMQEFRPQSVPLTQVEFEEICAAPGLMTYYTEQYGFSQEEMQIELERWLNFAKHSIPDPYEGMKEILNAYKQAGGTLWVTSHSDRTLIERDYRHHFGFAPDHILDLHFAPHKPAPDPILHILQHTHFKPADILVVDDLPAGLHMATAAGVDFAYAGWGTPPPGTHTYMMTHASHPLLQVQELANLIACR